MSSIKGKRNNSKMTVKKSNIVPVLSTSPASVHIDPVVHQTRAVSVPLSERPVKATMEQNYMTAANQEEGFKRKSISCSSNKLLEQPDDPELIITRGLKEILVKDIAARKKDNELVDSKNKKKNNNSNNNSKSKGPNFVICYLCGRQFGSSSISIHRPQCYLKMIIAWERGDPLTRGPRPLDPESYEKQVKIQLGQNVRRQNVQTCNSVVMKTTMVAGMDEEQLVEDGKDSEKDADTTKMSSKEFEVCVKDGVELSTEDKRNAKNNKQLELNEEEYNNMANKNSDDNDNERYNALALEMFKKQLAPCPHCHRTFLPDRLVVHLRGCKPKANDSVCSNDNNSNKTNKQINNDEKKNVIKDDQQQLHEAKMSSKKSVSALKERKTNNEITDIITASKKKKMLLTSDEQCKEEQVPEECGEEHVEVRNESNNTNNNNDDDNNNNDDVDVIINNTTVNAEESVEVTMSDKLLAMAPEARTESPRPHPPTPEQMTHCCNTRDTTSNEEVHLHENSTNQQEKNKSATYSTSRENSELLETLQYKPTTLTTATTTTTTTTMTESGRVENDNMYNETSNMECGEEMYKFKGSNSEELFEEEEEEEEEGNDNDSEVQDEVDDYEMKKIKLNNVSHFKNVPSRLKAELQAHRLRYAQAVACSICHKRFQAKKIKQHEELCALRHSTELRSNLESVKVKSKNKSKINITTTQSNSKSVDTCSSRSKSKSKSNAPQSSSIRTSPSLGSMPLTMSGPTMKFAELERSSMTRALSVDENKTSINRNQQCDNNNNNNNDNNYNNNSSSNNKSSINASSSNHNSCNIHKKLETRTKSNNVINKDATESGVCKEASQQVTLSSKDLLNEISTTNSNDNGNEVNTTINEKLITHDLKCNESIAKEDEHESSIAKKVELNFCPECGVKLQHEQQKFCMSCGTKIVV